MAPTQDFIPRLQWDETLLFEGRYGEWFWNSLSIAAKSWVRHAQCKYCGKTPHFTHCTCYKDLPKVAGWVNREGLVWQLRAACQGADIDVFFETNAALYNRSDAPWRKYCFSCEVTSDCVLYAVDSKSVGIFGGQLFGAKTEYASKNPAGTGVRGRPRREKEQ